MAPSNSYFPVYIQQETDLSGCTIFNGSLTKFYQDWSNFRKAYPNSYVSEVKANIEDIEKNLSTATCFCDKTAQPILKELEEFIKKNPKRTISIKIKNRIHDINSKKVIIPGCSY